MPNYKIGNIIRLTRLAEGISQEELCDNICSVQTLSRIENGKVSVKCKTYEQLMQRMGRNGNKAYSCLKINDFELLDIMRIADNLMFRREYMKTQKCIEEMKRKVNKNELDVMQYIQKMESIIDYELGRSSAREHLTRMEDALKLTIPNYRDFLKKTYPFTIEEIRILMNISNTYGELNDREKGILINYMLIRSLNTGYMSRNNTIPLLVNIIHGTARMYGGLGEYQKAIDMSQNAIDKAKRNHICSIFPTAYAEMAWNMLKQIENGQRNQKDILICKKYMRQAFAAAALSKQHTIGEVIRKTYQEYFNEEEIYSLGSGEKGEFSPTN